MSRPFLLVLASCLSFSLDVGAETILEAPTPPVPAAPVPAAPVPAAPVPAAQTVASVPQSSTVAPVANGVPSGYYLVPIASLKPRRESRWYGGQTLLADGASLSALLLTAVAAGGGSEDLAGLFAFSAVGGYLFGAPIVHGAHGNWGRAAGSLGLRVGAPILLGGIGSGVENCSGEERFCGVAGAVIGGLVGIGAAITLDAAVLAYDTVDITPQIVPIAAARKDGGWIGVAGAF